MVEALTATSAKNSSKALAAVAMGVMRLKLVKLTLCTRPVFLEKFGIILLWIDPAEALYGASPRSGRVSMEYNPLLDEDIGESDGVCVPS